MARSSPTDYAKACCGRSLPEFGHAESSASPRLPQMGEKRETAPARIGITAVLRISALDQKTSVWPGWKISKICPIIEFTGGRDERVGFRCARRSLPMSEEYIKEALDLERLQLTGAIDEINRDYQRKMIEVAADCRRRGLGISGPFATAIADTQMARAREIVKKHLEARNETISTVPAVGTDESYEALTVALERTVDTATQLIADEIRRQMGTPLEGPPAASMARRTKMEAASLKAFVRREVEILKRRSRMNSELGQVRGDVRPAPDRDPRKVWVVYGRNAAARFAMFQFLRAIGLEPLEWHEAVASAQAGAPYIGEVLDGAFAEVQGVVVLLTGDDLAHLRAEFLDADDGPDETTPSPQARPNVLFEAGMAFGRHPESTILVTLGHTRPFSDVAGRHTIRISNSVTHRQALAARLKAIGCAVVTETRTDWHEAGDFDAALPRLGEPPSSRSARGTDARTTNSQHPSPQPVHTYGALSVANLPVRYQMSDGAGGGITVRLENTGLEPLDDCRLTLISFASYHAEMKQFRRPSFQPLALIRSAKLNPEEVSADKWLARGSTDMMAARIPSGGPSEYRDNREPGIWRATFRVESGKASYEDSFCVEWQPGRCPAVVPLPPNAD